MDTKLARSDLHRSKIDSVAVLGSSNLGFIAE